MKCDECGENKAVVECADCRCPYCQECAEDLEGYCRCQPPTITNQLNA